PLALRGPDARRVWDSARRRGQLDRGRRRVTPAAFPYSRGIRLAALSFARNPGGSRASASHSTSGEIPRQSYQKKLSAVAAAAALLAGIGAAVAQSTDTSTTTTTQSTPAATTTDTSTMPASTSTTTTDPSST